MMSLRHLNLYLCISQVDAITYLIKHIFEGHDVVSVHLVGSQSRCNEITQFQDSLYVSATEAFWRLLQFDVIDQASTAVQLNVHLKDNHTVYFHEYRHLFLVRRGRPETIITE